MTDEDQNLTPARPVAPRHRLPANPQMAQPRMDVDAPKPAPAADQHQPPDQKDEGQLVPVPIVPAQPVTVPPTPPTPLAPALAPATAASAPVAASPVPAAAPPTPAPQPAPAPEAQSLAAASEEVVLDFPKTMRETLRRVDAAWAGFRAAAMRFPSERMDERLGEDAWSRKQMLQHIAAWHDLTSERLIKLINTGATPALDRDTDKFNASVARQAIGKTSGEILKDLDATFNRLRRQMSRMTDTQLEANNWWAAYVIGGNTYGHYEEHWADIYTAELPPGARR